MLERTNARRLTGDRLPVAPSFITADVSFISLRLALGPVLECARAGYRGLVLVKPQFEAGRELVGKGGVVSDPSRPPAGRADQAAARGSSSTAPRCSAHVRLRASRTERQRGVLRLLLRRQRTPGTGRDRPVSGGGAAVEAVHGLNLAACRRAHSSAPRDHGRRRCPSSPPGPPRSVWTFWCRPTKPPSTRGTKRGAIGRSTRISWAPSTYAWCWAATAPSCARSGGCWAPACPPLGVNFGNVGFLAEPRPARLERRARARPCAASYQVVELLTVEARPEGQRFTGVNDVVLPRVEPRACAAPRVRRLGHAMSATCSATA